MKRIILSAAALAAIGASLALSGCADDYYDRGYTSMSFGVSSGGGYGGYNRGYGWRDSDHDGVPNRYDPAPRNPYIR